MAYETIISHPAEKNAAEKPLQQHLFQVGKQCGLGIAELDLDLTIIPKEKLQRLAFLVGLFHDFGKATTFFQAYIRDTQKQAAKETRHSFLSAVVAFHFVKLEMGCDLWAYTAFQVIRRHHGHLQAFDMDVEESSFQAQMALAKKQLQNCIKHNYQPLNLFYSTHLQGFETLTDMDMDALPEVMEEWEELWEDKFENNDHKAIELFFLVNLLFSLLTDNDKKDAARLDTDYYSGNLQKCHLDVESYIKDKRQKQPGAFDPKTPINGLRNQFLKEIRENEGIGPGQHFYTLTAPTGIGKTFGVMTFAHRLIQTLAAAQHTGKKTAAQHTPGKTSKRIIYCLPYTSIIDQNHDEFEAVIRFNAGEAYDQRPGRYLLKHHHLATKEVKNRLSREEYRYRDYLDDTLLVDSWEAAVVVTSFVQFFHSIISNKNRLLKKFHHIVNSVVILDEVQNINPEYYGLLQEVLHVLGTRFKTYFLLTTATQPEIFHPVKSRPCVLVDSSHYMQHPLFNRVRLNWIRRQIGLEEFRHLFLAEFSEENALLVVNTKKTAVRLYDWIKEDKPAYRVFCLTTLSVPYDRRDKIKQIRQLLDQGEKVIVVSTQLIEAGVDLSFKQVYRDFGPLDSIVQVAGRCNRHGEYGELGGNMTLVSLSNEKGISFYSYIYKPIIAQLVNQTMTANSYQAKQFEVLAGDYFSKFDFKRQSSNLLKAVRTLDYDGEIKNFRLIEEYDTESIYLLITQEADTDMTRLLQCIRGLEEDYLNPKEKDTARLEIERLKTALKEFQISLRADELRAYQDYGILKDTEKYIYISLEDCRNYTYDDETGFLNEPKADVSGAVIF